jgi:hypothetical protein
MAHLFFSFFLKINLQGTISELNCVIFQAAPGSPASRNIKTAKFRVENRLIAAINIVLRNTFKIPGSAG